MREHTTDNVSHISILPFFSVRADALCAAVGNIGCDGGFGPFVCLPCMARFDVLYSSFLSVPVEYFRANLWIYFCVLNVNAFCLFLAWF
jgi:hypothetical protein